MKLVVLSSLVLAGSSLFLSACQRENVVAAPGLPYQSSFQKNSDGWVADITDYGLLQDTSMHFKTDWTALPSPLDATRKSLKLSSINRSDDAFMFLKKKVTGLAPNANYELTFTVELASSYANDSFGIGGSPGSSVYLKAGAVGQEPLKVLMGDHYSINLDKGNQSSTGTDVVALGNVATEQSTGVYQLITRSNAQPLTARTNANGELWLLIGSDSGYEGLTTLYYSRIDVSAKAVN